MRKKVFCQNMEAGQKNTNDPRLVEEIVKDFLTNSNSPFAQAYRRQQAELNAKEQAEQAMMLKAEQALKQQAELNAREQAEQAMMLKAELNAKEQAEQAMKLKPHIRLLNTELDVNLKTQLLNDVVMIPGKPYQGVLTKDAEVDEFLCDEHLTFIESAPVIVKRNPQVFNGQYITITRRSNGTYRPNLKPIEIGEGFDFIAYASAVGSELLWALESLIEK